MGRHCWQSYLDLATSKDRPDSLWPSLDGLMMKLKRTEPSSKGASPSPNTSPKHLKYDIQHSTDLRPQARVSIRIGIGWEEQGCSQCDEKTSSKPGSHSDDAVTARRRLEREVPQGGHSSGCTDNLPWGGLPGFVGLMEH